VDKCHSGVLPNFLSGGGIWLLALYDVIVSGCRLSNSATSKDVNSLSSWVVFMSVSFQVGVKQARRGQRDSGPNSVDG
jgi:hypothetical protein